MFPKAKKGNKFSPKNEDSPKIIPLRSLYGEIFHRLHSTRRWHYGSTIINGGSSGVSKSWRSVSKQCSSNRGQTSWLQLSCAIQDHGKTQPPILKIPFISGFYTSIDQGRWPSWMHYGPSSSSLVQRQSIIFTNAIGFKGKLYALSLQGALAVIEEVNAQFRITGFGRKRAIPSVSSRHFVQYLVESNGEFLLVFLISRKSTTIIDDVEVFKLDPVTLSCVKIDSLGDRALFLGIYCSPSVTAANQVGYKTNRVYFTHQATNCWKEFDMESSSISACCNIKGF